MTTTTTNDQEINDVNGTATEPQPSTQVEAAVTRHMFKPHTQYDDRGDEYNDMTECFICMNALDFLMYPRCICGQCGKAVCQPCYDECAASDAICCGQRFSERSKHAMYFREHFDNQKGYCERCGWEGTVGEFRALVQNTPLCVAPPPPPPPHPAPAEEDLPIGQATEESLPVSQIISRIASSLGEVPVHIEGEEHPVSDSADLRELSVSSQPAPVAAATSSTPHEYVAETGEIPQDNSPAERTQTESATSTSSSIHVDAGSVPPPLLFEEIRPRRQEPREVRRPDSFVSSHTNDDGGTNTSGGGDSTLLGESYPTLHSDEIMSESDGEEVNNDDEEHDRSNATAERMTRSSDSSDKVFLPPPPPRTPTEEERQGWVLVDLQTARFLEAKEAQRRRQKMIYMAFRLPRTALRIITNVSSSAAEWTTTYYQRHYSPQQH